MIDASYWYFFLSCVVVLIALVVLYRFYWVRKMASDNPKGIRGWLMFFVIILGLIAIMAPLTTYQGYQKTLLLLPALKFHEDVHRAYYLELCVSGFQSLVCAYLIYILITKKIAPTIKTVITGIWLVSFWSNAVYAVLYYVVAPNLFPHVILRSLWVLLLPPIIFSIVWTLYFLKSKRVKNTYPSVTVVPD